MSIPKSVTVSGVEYTVELVEGLTLKRDDITKELFGRIDFKKQHISIEKNMHPDTQRIALLHEIMHCMSAQAGHHDISDWEEERLIVCFSHAIINLIRADRRLLEYLLCGNGEFKLEKLRISHPEFFSEIGYNNNE